MNNSVYFADYALDIRTGLEIGRTKNGERIAIDQGHTITVIEENRVFSDELSCCRFVLGELTKQYKAVSDKSDRLLDRMRELSISRGEE